MMLEAEPSFFRRMANQLSPKSHLKKTKEQFQTKGDSLEFKIMIFKS